MNHSDQCNAQVEALRTFNKQHPSCCNSCGGRGYAYSAGSYWESPEMDICGTCLGDCKCPQCARELKNKGADDSPMFCPGCGWDEEGKASDYPIRPEPECFCCLE